MKIINLMTYQLVTDENPPADGTTCMYVHREDANGNPLAWEIKAYYAPVVEENEPAAPGA